MATKRHRKSKHLLATLVTENRAPCAFCQRNVDDEVTYGKLYAIGDIQCHYFCVLLSCCLIQKARDTEGLFGFLYDDILAEIERSKKHKCSYCREGGATLGCAISQCRRQFHLPCGREKSAVSLFYGNFKSFCRDHAPKQQIPDHIMVNVRPRLKQARDKNKKNSIRNGASGIKEVAGTTEPAECVCVICYETVEGFPSPQTFWPPCCARDAWFHRICLQRMALTAGMHYLKCPLCNDKDNFYDAVISQGYYIPDRDAAWELEQNAFAEIYERPLTCSATDCQCPSGREHDDDTGPWDIILCILCGTTGIHAACHKVTSKNELQDNNEVSNNSESQGNGEPRNSNDVRNNNESGSSNNDLGSGSSSDIRDLVNDNGTIVSDDTKCNSDPNDSVNNERRDDCNSLESNDSNGKSESIGNSESTGNSESSGINESRSNSQSRDITRFVCIVCKPAAPKDIEALASTIDKLIESEQRRRREVPRHGPLMPSRMSLRRTKQRIENKPSTSRTNLTESINTAESEKSQNISASRQELNLKTPKCPPKIKEIQQHTDENVEKIQDETNDSKSSSAILKNIENHLLSPLKILEQSLNEKIKCMGAKGTELDSQNVIERVRDTFKKPRPLREKKRILNEILESLFDSLSTETPKIKEPVTVWSSTKKNCMDSDEIIQVNQKPLKHVDENMSESIIVKQSIMENEMTEEETEKDYEKRPELKMKEINFKDVTVSNISDLKINDDMISSAKTLQIISISEVSNDSLDSEILDKDLISEDINIVKETVLNVSDETVASNIETINDSGEDISFKETPKLKTVDIEKDSSLEISANDDVINIDVLKIGNTNNNLTDSNAINPVVIDKHSIKLNVNKEILKTHNIQYDLESFKNYYLNEIDKSHSSIDKSVKTTRETNFENAKCDDNRKDRSISEENHNIKDKGTGEKKIKPRENDKDRNISKETHNIKDKGTGDRKSKPRENDKDRNISKENHNIKDKGTGDKKSKPRENEKDRIMSKVNHNIKDKGTGDIKSKPRENDKDRNISKENHNIKDKGTGDKKSKPRENDKKKDNYKLHDESKTKRSLSKTEKDKSVSKEKDKNETHSKKYDLKGDSKHKSSKRKRDEKYMKKRILNKKTNEKNEKTWKYKSDSKQIKNIKNKDGKERCSERNDEQNRSKLKRKLTNDEEMAVKKRKYDKCVLKYKKNDSQIEVVCSKENKNTTESIEVSLDSKSSNSSSKTKNRHLSRHDIKLKIKWREERLRLKITKKKKKQKEIEQKRMKQYILSYKPELPSILAKPEDDVTPIKRKYIKQEKTPDNLKQTSIDSFFQIKVADS